MSEPKLHLKDFPDRRPVFYAEGGVVYTAARAGRFYAIVDEGTLADFLGGEITSADSLVGYYDFPTESDREAFLQERGWNRRSSRMPDSGPDVPTA